MAFKKTNIGDVRVTPVGMPDLSGYKSFAKAMESTAQNVGSIGTSMRKREYTEALLQAEIDGKTAGVTYDENGNLVPLKNLNYGVADKFFGINDAKNLQRKYEENAIASYALAISNDSNKAANNALANNPKDPNGIRASLDGYISGLGDMPDQVRNAIMPNVTANFIEAENRARAAQIKQSRDDQEQIALESIDINSKKLANIFATSPNAMAEHGQMVSELQDSIVASQEILRGLGYTDKQLETQNNKVRTNIAITASEKIVDDLLSDGDIVMAWNEMQDIKREFDIDPNIDGDLVEVAMNEVWNFYTKRTLLMEQEQSDISTSAYNGFLIDIVDDQVDNPSVRQILDDPDMNEGHKYALINVLQNAEASKKGRIEAARNAQQKVYDEQYETFMININNPDNNNLTPFYTSGAKISNMYANDQIGAKQFNTFINAYNKYNKKRLENAVKDGAAVTKANLALQMGEIGGYIRPPEEFFEIMQDLEEQGVITRDGPFTFNDKTSLLNTYTKNYNQKSAEREDLRDAVTKAKSNQSLSSKEITLIEKHLAPKVINVDGETIKLDLFSDDPFIQQQSLATAVRYSTQYPNLVHPQIKQALKDIQFVTDEDSFNASKQFLGSLASSMRATGQYGVFLQNLERNGFDQSVLWNAENYSFEDFRAIMESQSENAQRKLSALISKDRDKTDYFLSQFNNLKGEAEGDQVRGIFFSYALLGTKTSDELSDNERFFINNFETKYGVSIEDAILQEPRIISLLEDRAFAYVANGKYDATDKGMRGAIIKSMTDLIGVVGIEEVGDEYRFTLKPITHEANKTAPEAIEIYKEDIVDDVIYRINQVPSLSGPDFQEAASNRENYFFELNDMTFDRPSYDVYLKVGRENILVFSDYRFDFSHSYMNEDYMQALDSFQNDTTKQLWRMVPFIDGALLNKTFRKYKSTSRETYSDKGVIEDLITFYNNNIAYNLGGIDYIDPDDIGDRDIQAFIQAWMTLGFR